MKPAAAAAESGETSGAPKRAWRRRGFAMVDLILRLLALSAILASAIAMGTTDDQLPIFTQFFQFEAKYSDMPAFNFFVIATGIASVYIVLSLPVSIYNIVRGHVAISRLLLLVLDMVIMGLVTAGASAATAIVRLANDGNQQANWFGICQQFDSFCQQSGMAVIVSFVGVGLLVVLVTLSAFLLYRKR